MTETNPEQHLFDMLADFSTAMLATRGTDGAFHARPMAVAQLKPDMDVYFATDVRSQKVAEMNKDVGGLVSFQSSSEFASLSGTAQIVTDRALVERLWSEAWRVWFPGGKSDPNLVLIRFDAKSAEYWDNSGTEGLRYMFEGLKAYVSGRRPATDVSQHAKVDLI